MSTREQFAEYDVRRGKLWPLPLLVIALAPLFDYRRRSEG